MDVTMVVFCRVCLRSCVGCWSNVVILPPGACPTCCWVLLVTCEVVYASVLSVVFGFNLLCTIWVNTCTYMVLRLIVGWVFTGCMGCCILFLGSAIGCWLFAVTVYWMFGSVAWLLVGWWPSGWMWVMRCLLVGFFFFLGHRPMHVHDTALVSLWGCLQSVCFG